MKKLIIAFLLVLNSTAAFAQLKVHKNGKTSIGLTTGTPQSQLSILSEGDSNNNFLKYGKEKNEGLFENI